MYDDNKNMKELSDGMKGVICILLGVISWPVFFTVGTFLLSLVFEETVVLHVVWGAIVTLGLFFSVYWYIEEEL